jgi:cytochrome c-type biogenesis protein
MQMAYSPDNSQARVLAWAQHHQTLLIVVSVFLAIVISASWLVFPYFIKGKELIGEVGGSYKQEKLKTVISIGKYLSRTSFGVGEAQVDVLYATTKYFEVTDRARVVSKFRPDRNLVFFVTETTHIEELPTHLPTATLIVDGNKYHTEDVEGPLVVYHHRVVSIRFPAFNENNAPILKPDSRKLVLELESSWDPPGSPPRAFSWDLPIEYPPGLEMGGSWTPLMVLGLSAGLLSFVLTPCLLQLLVVYLVTLTGFSAEQLGSGEGAISKEASRRLFYVALSFVSGFALLFPLTGAAIGYAGKEAQMFFAIWSPTLTVLAGILVVIMGIWMGIRSRAPLVCKLVPEKVLPKKAGKASYIGSAITAIGFSLGCLTCFGGAIIATLLVYVGALGSAFIGAMVMLAFSLGVVVPFLLSAFFLSRMLPLLRSISAYVPQIGFVSMLIVVAFGLVLITDNFHVLSDLIYPYLGLG